MESAHGTLRLGPPLSLRSGNTYRASGSILCSAMRDGCSGPGARAWLGQVSRSSDRHSTVVLNVARRHRASQTEPGRQGRGSRRAWPGGAMCRTRSEVCWPEQGSLAGFGADDEPEKLQMVRRRSTVRFRKGALAHKPGRRRLTCTNTVRRRLRVLRLATAEAGSLRLVVPNMCPSLSQPSSLAGARRRRNAERRGRPSAPRDRS